MSNFELVEIDLGDVRLTWKEYQSKALDPKNLFMTIPDLSNLISRSFRAKNFAHVHMLVNGLGGCREAQTIELLELQTNLKKITCIICLAYLARRM